MNEPRDTADTRDADRRERRTRWERRFQSVTLSVATAGILWAGSTLGELKVSSAVIQNRVDGLDAQMSGLYRANDAKRDVNEMKARIATTEQRVEAIEGRIASVERQHVRGARP